MPKKESNTQIIKDLVAGIPALSETWDKAINDQTDDNISNAWLATVNHFLLNHDDYYSDDPSYFLKESTKKDLTKILKKSSIKILMGIGNILSAFDKNELPFGEEERIYKYQTSGMEGARFCTELFIHVTKTLNGYSYRLLEEDSELESWIGEKLLSMKECKSICKENEDESSGDFDLGLEAEDDEGY